MRSSLRFFALLAVTAAASNAAADDLWIDASSPACDDARSREDNALDTPWCSLRPAERLPRPGDVVHVRPGSYRDEDGDGFIVNVRVSGTADLPILLRSEERWGARLAGDVSDTTHCINTATAVHHVVIEGFEITGCHTAINVNNDNHYVTVRGNWIHDIGRRVTSTTSGQSGISYGGGSTFLTVDGNLFHTIGRLPGSDHAENHDHGVYIRSTDVTIVNNVFYDIVAGWPIHIYAPSSWKERILIAFNTFAEPNPHRPGHILIYPLTREVSIRDNLFLDPRDAPVRNVGCEGRDGVSLVGNATTVGRWIDGDACDIEVRDNLASVADLGFVDAADHDFRLLPGSIAVDAASGPAPDRDFAGTPRPRGSAADMGAFELEIEEPARDAGWTARDAGASDAGTSVSVTPDAGAATPPDATASNEPPADIDSGSAMVDGGCSSTGGRPRGLAFVLVSVLIWAARRRTRAPGSRA